jgi:hypothetical protein
LKDLFIAAQLLYLNFAFVLLCYSAFKNPTPSGLSLSIITFYTTQQTATHLQEYLTRYMPVHPAQAI